MTTDRQIPERVTSWIGGDKLIERNVKPDFAEFREEAIKERQALEQQQ